MPDDFIQMIGTPGEMRATIHIKRAATGEIETFEIVGRPIAMTDAEGWATACLAPPKGKERWR